jgi:hypothetical protein
MQREGIGEGEREERASERERAGGGGENLVSSMMIPTSEGGVRD